MPTIVAFCQSDLNNNCIYRSATFINLADQLTNEMSPILTRSVNNPNKYDISLQKSLNSNVFPIELFINNKYICEIQRLSNQTYTRRKLTNGSTEI